MKKLNKKIAAVALSAAITATGLLSGAILNNSALAAYANENITTVGSEDVSPAELCTLDPPIFKGADYSSYYCLATYAFMQDNDHTYQIVFKQTESSQNNSFSLTAANEEIVYYVVAPDVGSNEVTPAFKVCRLYCSECGAHSSYNTDLRGKSGTLTKLTTNVIGKTGAATTIPTSYDETDTVWEHKTAAYNKLAFSVAYNGVVKNGVLKVPLIGTNETSFTIDGVTFSVRTGPFKISIKASTAIECNLYNTMFAFKSNVIDV